MLGLDLNRGEMMLTTFAGTTLIILAVLGISARNLERRPVRAYGHSLSGNWWLDLVVGTGLGGFIIALTFVVARSTGPQRLTSSTDVPDAASLG